MEGAKEVSGFHGVCALHAQIGINSDARPSHVVEEGLRGDKVQGRMSHIERAICQRCTCRPGICTLHVQIVVGCEYAVP